MSATTQIVNRHRKAHNTNSRPLQSHSIIPPLNIVKNNTGKAPVAVTKVLSSISDSPSSPLTASKTQSESKSNDALSQHTHERHSSRVSNSARTLPLSRMDSPRMRVILPQSPEDSLQSSSHSLSSDQDTGSTTRRKGTHSGRYPDLDAYSVQSRYPALDDDAVSTPDFTPMSGDSPPISPISPDNSLFSVFARIDSLPQGKVNEKIPTSRSSMSTEERELRTHMLGDRNPASPAAHNRGTRKHHYNIGSMYSPSQHTFDEIYEDLVDVMGHRYDFNPTEAMIDAFLTGPDEGQEYPHKKVEPSHSPKLNLQIEQFFGVHRKKMNHIDMDLIHSVDVSQLLRDKDTKDIHKAKSLIPYMLKLNLSGTAGSSVSIMDQKDLLKILQVMQVLLDMKYHECEVTRRKDHLFKEKKHVHHQEVQTQVPFVSLLDEQTGFIMHSSRHVEPRMTLSVSYEDEDAPTSVHSTPQTPAQPSPHHVRNHFLSAPSNDFEIQFPEAITLQEAGVEEKSPDSDETSTTTSHSGRFEDISLKRNNNETERPTCCPEKHSVGVSTEEDIALAQESVLKIPVSCQTARAPTREEFNTMQLEMTLTEIQSMERERSFKLQMIKCRDHIKMQHDLIAKCQHGLKQMRQRNVALLASKHQNQYLREMVAQLSSKKLCAHHTSASASPTFELDDPVRFNNSRERFKFPRSAMSKPCQLKPLRGFTRDVLQNVCRHPRGSLETSTIISSARQRATSISFHTARSK